MCRYVKLKMFVKYKSHSNDNNKETVQFDFIPVGVKLSLTRHSQLYFVRWQRLPRQMSSVDHLMCGITGAVLWWRVFS